MNDISDEIFKLKDRFNLTIEEAIAVFYALLVKLYFMGKVGKRFERQIDSLISSQINSSLPFQKVVNSFIGELEKNLKEYLVNEEIKLFPTKVLNALENSFDKREAS